MTARQSPLLCAKRDPHISDSETALGELETRSSRCIRHRAGSCTVLHSLQPPASPARSPLSARRRLPRNCGQGSQTLHSHFRQWLGALTYGVFVGWNCTGHPPSGETHIKGMLAHLGARSTFSPQVAAFTLSQSAAL